MIPFKYSHLESVQSYALREVPTDPIALVDADSNVDIFKALFISHPTLTLECVIRDGLYAVNAIRLGNQYLGMSVITTLCNTFGLTLIDNHAISNPLGCLSHAAYVLQSKVDVAFNWFDTDPVIEEFILYPMFVTEQCGHDERIELGDNDIYQYLSTSELPAIEYIENSFCHDTDSGFSIIDEICVDFTRDSDLHVAQALSAEVQFVQQALMADVRHQFKLSELSPVFTVHSVSAINYAYQQHLQSQAVHMQL